MWTLNNEEVGKRLKIIRESKDFSSRKFATKAKVDPSQYAKIESGTLPITEKIMEKLKAAFDLNQNYILYGTNIPNISKNIEDEHSNKSTVSESNEISKYSTLNKNTDKIIEDLAASSRDHAAADLKRAEAEVLREQNHKRIIDHITGHANAGSPITLETILPELQEILVDLGTGKRWKTKDDALSAVHNKLFSRLSIEKSADMKDG